ncbi:MAG: hypothetical protein L6R38_002581 [Xanthoria sp. 2 TBL-2021]|nr:MAG: hypothetical protein L6R38_002581 [Xanthoria sp. 2 TBL-2021]
MALEAADEPKVSSGLYDDDDAASLNINSKLVNPFVGKTHEEMDDLITRFMEKTRIDGIYDEHIRKGAYLAQDQSAFDDLREDALTLKPEERSALRMEDPKTGNKWNQPWILYALVGCCSLGAAVQGWDETAVNGAQLYYVYAFGIGEDSGDAPDDRDAGLRGLVNSAPYLCCAVLGCWLTGPMNRLLGRRGTILVTCLISSLTCLWQAFTSSWWHLFIARLVLGLGIGPKSATIPIYAAECTPANIRGALVMLWQMFTAAGIMLGYVAGVAFRSVLDGGSDGCSNDRPVGILLGIRCSLNWRLMLASPMILPLVAVAYVYTLPESPRWLLSNARQGKTQNFEGAFSALCKLRHTRLQAARDLFLMDHLLDNEEHIKQNHNIFFELWSVPRNRRALVASLILMFFQQFCGVNVLAYYSSTVFEDAGLKGQEPLLASMGFGIINFLFAIPAFYTIDTFGRRNLLLFTFPFMALFQLLTGLGFLLEGRAQLAMVMTGMYLFSVAYSPGEGPVPFLYSAESMPLYVRDVGMSMATALTWFFNFLLAVTFPSFQNAFGNTGAFGYYAAWCMVGWVLILLFVPETKDLTLEQLDARFSISSRSHARYAMKQCSYFIRHYVLRRQHVKRPTIQLPQEDDYGQSNTDQPRKISFDKDERIPTPLSR